MKRKKNGKKKLEYVFHFALKWSEEKEEGKEDYDAVLFLLSSYVTYEEEKI